MIMTLLLLYFLLFSCNEGQTLFFLLFYDAHFKNLFFENKF